MASKTMKMQIERVQDDNLIYYTNNAEYYGYMIGLVIELFEFINPLITYESCISSNEKISILMSDIFADDADKVIDSFDELYKEYQNGDFKKMAEIFINTQKLMYKRFFSINYKKAEDADQLNMVVQKMEDFAKVLAVRVSDGKEVAEDKEDFENFKSEMHKDYFQKYLEVDKQQKNTQLVVVKEGILARFFRWIKEKFNEKNSTN
jgi:thiaminase